jgi:GTP-binding protein
LADVGLVGFPNAGKSTLISRISAARPKIADYPFTTLTPNLGVVETRERDSFVVADIPGLIAGAHEGAGLGHGFLRHIERTRVLLYILDAAETDGRDVLQDYQTLRHELGSHNSQLLQRPALIVANKMDLPRAVENRTRLQEAFGDELMFISAVTGLGVAELIERVYRLLQDTPRPEVEEVEEVVVTRFVEEAPFTITIIDGVYVVTGNRIEKLLTMTNFSTDEGLQRFQRTINRMGLEDALKAQGIKEGDTVRIKDMEFDYSE